MNFMHKLAFLLENKPEIGIISSITAAGLSFTSMEEVLKYSGMGLGILIGLVTLYIKLIHAFKVTRDINKKAE